VCAGGSRLAIGSGGARTDADDDEHDEERVHDGNQRRSQGEEDLFHLHAAGWNTLSSEYLKLSGSGRLAVSSWHPHNLPQCAVKSGTLED
jgi:hypothetical protein